MRRYFSSNCFVQYLLSQNAWQCHMFLHMCMHVHVYVCMCVFVFVCIYVYVHTCMSPCVCVCVCVCVCLSTLLDTGVACMHFFASLCMFVCMFVCIYLFIVWIYIQRYESLCTCAHMKSHEHMRVHLYVT